MTDLAQRVSEAREVRRLNMRARAAAAIESGDEDALTTIVNESVALGSDGLEEVNAVLAERAAAAAVAVEAERRHDLQERIWQAAARRTAAVERAETALGQLIDGLAEAEASRVTLAQLAAAVPAQLPAPLEQSEATLRASRFVAAALARLGTESRYGGITFPMGLTLGATGSWAETERATVERFASSLAADRAGDGGQSND